VIRTRGRPHRPRYRDLLRNGLPEELWGHGREARLAELERGAEPFRAEILMAFEGLRAPRRRGLDPERVATLSEFAPPGGLGWRRWKRRTVCSAGAQSSPRQDYLLRAGAPRRWQVWSCAAIKLTNFFAGLPTVGIFACSPAYNPQKA
jgi:hypothetical protein